MRCVALFQHSPPLPLQLFNPLLLLLCSLQVAFLQQPAGQVACTFIMQTLAFEIQMCSLLFCFFRLCIISARQSNKDWFFSDSGGNMSRHGSYSPWADSGGLKTSKMWAKTCKHPQQRCTSKNPQCTHTHSSCSREGSTAGDTSGCQN